MGQNVIGSNLMVTDITGKVVKEIKMTANSEIFDVSDLTNGVYYITSSNNNSLKPYKLVKIK
jgi:hypothetical protein